jgi:transposase
MAQIKRSNRRRDLSPVHPDAAAIDIGATMHVAAVSPERDPEPVRTFGTVTSELHRLADWFESCGIKTIAMESTGVYWIPAYEILEQRGFEVVLVNARDAKHVPGRKSDVSDAQWLQRLHECSGAASGPRGRSPRCGLTCVSASACWITWPLTSSTCRRR